MQVSKNSSGFQLLMCSHLVASIYNAVISLLVLSPGTNNVGTAGSFGSSTLWLAKYEGDEDRLYVARKTAIDQLSAKDLENMQEETKLSTFLHHPCILFSFTSFVVTEGHIWSIFPLFDYGSCHDLIVAEFHNGLPILLAAMVIRSVLLALEYLHKMGFIHRGVKGSHILLNSDGTACLSGLRYCLPLDDGNAHCFPDNAIPLLPWLAPEILQQNLCGYNTKADIYSVGITAVELVTGTIPFNKLRSTEILLQKVRGVVPQLPDEATIEELHCDINTSHCSLEGLDQTNDMMSSPHLGTCASLRRIKSLRQFVDVCLQSDPKARPTASQLKDCPYIRGIKRKLKEKDCPCYEDLLQPLSPVKEFQREKAECTAGKKSDQFIDSDSITSTAEKYWLF